MGRLFSLTETLPVTVGVTALGSTTTEVTAAQLIGTYLETQPERSSFLALLTLQCSDNPPLQLRSEQSCGQRVHMVTYTHLSQHQTPATFKAMGTCVCRGNQVILSHANLLETIAQAIEHDDLSTIRDIYESIGRTQGPPYAISPFNFDDTVVVIHGVELNALALCIRVGYADIAKYLIEVVHCNLRLLYAEFQTIGKTPAHIICEYGHLALMKYFIPFHLDYLARTGRSHSSIPDDYEELSVFQEAKQKRRNPLSLSSINSQTPIQRACEFSQLDLIKFIWEYMKDYQMVRDFDLHAIDERSGENSALIAARIGDLSLMEFLFFECEVDFTLKTKRKETALQLSVLSRKFHNSDKVYECIKFLLEKVKLDVTYEYEETLLLCDDSVIQEYIEDRLEACGISACKEVIEEANEIKRSNPRCYSKGFAELEERVKAAGPEFQLQRLFEEELAVSNVVSPIPPISMTPFSAISREPTPDSGVKV